MVFVGMGCGIGPKNFRGITHPAPVVRARSAAMGDNLPEERVVPTLIDRLEDTDPVVRLSSYEELRRRTGQDFGYLPWGDLDERGRSVAQWRAWWGGRKADLAKIRKIP